MNNLLIGTYDCKLDSKGRFLFSSALRIQLGEIYREGFVLKRGLFGKYLELFPMGIWKEETQKLLEKSRLVKKNAEYMRWYVASAKIVEPDSLGRIQIPKDLFNFAGFNKDIVITSVFDKIEIWDKDAYYSEVQYDQNDFAQMTEELFGNTGNE